MSKLVKHARLLLVAGAIVIAAFFVFILTGASSGVSTNSAEYEALSEAIIGAESVSAQVGSFTSSDGTVASLSDEEIQTTIEDFNERLDYYFSSDNSISGTYKELNENILTQACSETVDYTVNVDVQDLTLNEVDFDEDGTSVTVNYTVLLWGTWVVENTDGSETYQIISPVNQDTVDAVFVKEDGVWKLQEVLNRTKLMWSKSYNAVNCTYDSFDEALAAAKSLDFDELNVF